MNRIAALFRSNVLLACLIVLFSPRIFATTLVESVVDAYGGAEALEAIESIVHDQAGYFIGRYQSRDTLPPWDRLPVRTFAALDFEAETGAWETISTWPGELNMGTRSVVGPNGSRTLNTISRIYTEGSMHGFSYMSNTTAYLLPAFLVRTMARQPGTAVAGEPRRFNHITYDTLRYKDRLTLYIHPETRLIDVMETVEGGMWDHTLDENASIPVQRVYRGYFEQDGVMFPRRYQLWIGGEATRDVSLHTLALNQDIKPFLAIPDGFTRVQSTDGYSGDWEISVREIGEGIYVAGGGETRILYVEFDDHFVALEAGGFPSYGADVHQAMKPHMDDKPLRYIVPLHHHDDHAWAVHYYSRAGATILTTRDKEGFLRKLLARTWGDHGPVTDARFEYLEEGRNRLADATNTLDLWVWPKAPHSENMVVAYHENSSALFTGDFYIGWASPDGGSVRQGATYGVRELQQWIEANQADGQMGTIRQYIAVHGRAYDDTEWRKMLETPRTVTTLPNNEAWPTASWPARYGLADDTSENPRRKHEATKR